MIDKFIQKRFAKIITQLDSYNRYSQRKLHQSFENKYEQKLIIIFLYLSQIDIFKNVKTLLENENPIAISILVRSAIDLIALMKIANKDINKIISHYKHKVTLDIKNIITDLSLSSSELKNLNKPELINIALLLDSFSNKKIELKNIKKEKMLEHQKRKNANISDELDQLYNYLSDHVHHGYDALVQRHGIIKKNNYQASVSKKIPNPLVYMWIHGLLLCLQSSLCELFKCIDLPINHNLKLIYVEINNLDNILRKKIEKNLKMSRI